MNPEIKKKHHINIIDLVLVLALIACAAGVFIRSNLHETVLIHNEQKVNVTILSEALLDESTEAFHLNDVFRFTTNNEDFGILRNMEFSPAKLRFFNDDGTITITHYYDRKDAVFVFEATGYDTDNGFMINGNTFVGCGSTFNLQSKFIEMQCTVLDIQSQS